MSIVKKRVEGAMGWAVVNEGDKRVIVFQTILEGIALPGGQPLITEQFEFVVERETAEKIGKQLSAPSVVLPGNGSIPT